MNVPVRPFNTTLRLQDDSLHSTTDSTTHVLSTLEKEEDLLRLWDDSLHSTTDSTTHVLSTLSSHSRSKSSSFSKVDNT
jgi:hypothetical protein